MSPEPDQSEPSVGVLTEPPDQRACLWLRLPDSFLTGCGREFSSVQGAGDWQFCEGCGRHVQLDL